MAQWQSETESSIPEGGGGYQFRVQASLRKKAFQAVVYRELRQVHVIQQDKIVRAQNRINLPIH